MIYVQSPTLHIANPVTRKHKRCECLFPQQEVLSLMVSYEKTPYSKRLGVQLPSDTSNKFVNAREILYKFVV